MRFHSFAALVAMTLAGRTVPAQSSGAARLKSGKEIYEAGCAGCHGREGKGAPPSITVFQRPETFPDFTRCDQTTPEDDLAWKSVIRDGGPSRGFSHIMPVFGEALREEQIEAVVKYMRGFCKEKGWPRGELNLPRALATEKAFPEDEVVITTALNARATPGVSNEVAYEQRFGKKNQIEIAVPIDFQRPAPGLWYGGVGDVSIGVKRAFFSSLRTGSIFAMQGEIVLPSGNVSHGLGSGVTTFTTFAAFGQLLPAKTFLQAQAGADLPTDTARAPQAMFLRFAGGKFFNQKAGLGRMWTPMVELLADRELETGATMNWDIMPEFQVTLSRRQHVRFDVGVRMPATNRAGRDPQVVFYLLWDWLDGKLLEGWK